MSGRGRDLRRGGGLSSAPAIHPPDEAIRPQNGWSLNSSWEALESSPSAKLDGCPNNACPLEPDPVKTPHWAVGIGRPASQRLPEYADRPIPSPNCGSPDLELASRDVVE